MSRFGLRRGQSCSYRPLNSWPGGWGDSFTTEMSATWVHVPVIWGHHSQGSFCSRRASIGAQDELAWRNPPVQLWIGLERTWVRNKHFIKSLLWGRYSLSPTGRVRAWFPSAQMWKASCQGPDPPPPWARHEPRVGCFTPLSTIFNIGKMKL